MQDEENDFSRMMNEFFEYNRHFEKAWELFLNPPRVRVGRTPHDIVYTDGKLKLLHYHPMTKKKKVSVPILITYALINRPYILDLQPDRSVIQRLLLEGFDVYMIDWGDPDEDDRTLTMKDHIEGYMDNVVNWIKKETKSKQINLFGYCQGGTFSVMYAALHPKNIRNLIIMAAPLIFETDKGILHIWSKKEYFDVDKLVDTMGNVPGEFMNMTYAMLDPVNNLYTKYMRFMTQVDDTGFVEMFFRMERWINDSPAQPGETFREFIKNGYQDNLLVQNKWRIGRRVVNLKKIDMPLLLIIGTFDHLVPPEATRAFPDYVSSKEKKTIEIASGHIGLSVSSKAHKELWPEVCEWIGKHSGGK
jgi:polyhydroxyalkanoate synthase